MVTNGGYGGVMIALTHGVPLVVAGTTEDKAEVAGRVAYAGVGVNLKTSTPTPTVLHAAVRRVLTEPGFRDRARQISQLLQQTNAPATAAAALETLARTKQPVLARTGTMESSPMRIT
jgi:UDP:flavonoid glycosyltransferase YjiC (YdhE family)